jgi:hypothetical protein
MYTVAASPGEVISGAPTLAFGEGVRGWGADATGTGATGAGVCVAQPTTMRTIKAATDPR